jgi:hypothetical protein
VCTLAECADEALCAHFTRMGSQPKSQAVAEYRRQIAVYLEAVRIATGWKDVRMGEEAGGLAHTTIGRARKGKNTLSFPALLALEEASGCEIPPSLRGAAIAALQPARRERQELQEKIRNVAADLSAEEQEELLEELKKRRAMAR